MTDTHNRMADIDHTHPDLDRPAGAMFRRGPAIIADGGRRDATDEETEEDDEETMADVRHTPPHGGGANAVHRRGQDDDE